MSKVLIRILAAVGLGLAVIFFVYFGQLKRPSTLEQAVIIEIPSGAGVDEIAGQLNSEGIISSVWTFKAYAVLSGAYTHLPSGRFKFEPSLNTQEVIQLLASGTARQEVEVTLLEGWTIQEMDSYLSGDLGLFTPGEFVQAAQVTDSRIILPEETYDFLRSKPDDVSLEGYLFPDTYRLFIDSQPKDLIKKMLDNFGQQVTPELVQKIRAKNLNVHEAVTMASLLEKEAATAEDKQIVASILIKRIELAMRLQLDTTVIYATGTPGAELTGKDLEFDSPYNTYVYSGLPIGPIGNPGLVSIQAVTKATDTDYLFFITDPAGTVFYSTTYEEHLNKKNSLYP